MQQTPFPVDALMGIIFAILGIIAVIAAPFVLIILKDKIKEARRVAKSPPQGPMQVTITTKDHPYGSLYRKELPVHMVVDVKISQKDWATINRLGIQERILFESPNPAAEDHRQVYYVRNLRQVIYPSFSDAIERDEAKWPAPRRDTKDYVRIRPLVASVWAGRSAA